MVSKAFKMDPFHKSLQQLFTKTSNSLLTALPPSPPSAAAKCKHEKNLHLKTYLCLSLPPWLFTISSRVSLHMITYRPLRRPRRASTTQHQRHQRLRSADSPAFLPSRSLLFLLLLFRVFPFLCRRRRLLFGHERTTSRLGGGGRATPLVKTTFW